MGCTPGIHIGINLHSLRRNWPCAYDWVTKVPSWGSVSSGSEQSLRRCIHWLLADERDQPLDLALIDGVP